MGSLQARNGYTLIEQSHLIHVRKLCKFAVLIMKNARMLTQRNVANKWPMNSEQMSLELFICTDLHFSDINNLYGYLPEDFDYWHAPEIEVGNAYNINVKRTNSNDLGFDVIKYSVGFMLRSYCCYLVRTEVFNHSRQCKENSEFLMLVYQQVLKLLKHGSKLCQVYKDVQLFAETKNEKLSQHLQREFGFSLDLNSNNEPPMVISPTSKTAVQKGMFFAINITLNGLKENDNEYSLSYGDTVIIRKDQPPEVLTYYEEKA